MYGDEPLDNEDDVCDWAPWKPPECPGSAENDGEVNESGRAYEKAGDGPPCCMSAEVKMAALTWLTGTVGGRGPLST